LRDFIFNLGVRTESMANFAEARPTIYQKLNILIILILA
jgi:hypothetical protein